MRIPNSVFDIEGVEIHKPGVNHRKPATAPDIPKDRFRDKEEVRDHLEKATAPLRRKIHVFLSCSASNRETATQALRDELGAQQYPEAAIGQIMTALETQRTARKDDHAMRHVLRAIGRPSAKTR
jgi:hypothetical protein